MKTKKSPNHKQQTANKKLKHFLEGDLNKTAKLFLKNNPCIDNPLLAEQWRLWMYLRRLYHVLDVAFEKELKILELTPAQFTALLTIIAFQGLSMSDLAALCLWNRSTASRITHSLKKKGLIDILPVDGKTSALEATKKGKKLAADYFSRERDTFKYSLMIIAGEAVESNKVNQWLQNSLAYLIGDEVIKYIENVYKSIKSASSP
ncbi:MAG: MarR family transcriptional regulator [Desulfotomaculum sp.]|nr:MarR family transcriptional regulator [Desulfotomaculum sp.]